MRKDHLENFSEELASGAIQFVKDEDEVEFKCQMCGACCFNQSILLSSYEIYQITRSASVREMFGINSTVELYSKGYAELILGCDSKLPLAHIINKEVPDGTQVCPFILPAIQVPEEFFYSWTDKRQIAEDLLSEAKTRFILCGLDEAGPLVCKSYPFGRISRQTKEEHDAGKPPAMREVFLPVTCAGAGKGHISTGDYLKALNVREGWKATDDHFSFLGWLGSDEVDIQTMELQHLSKIAQLLYNFDGFPFLLDKEGKPYEPLKASFTQIFESIVMTIQTMVRMIKSGIFPEDPVKN